MHETPSSVTAGLSATCGLFDRVLRATRIRTCRHEFETDRGVQQSEHPSKHAGSDPKAFWLRPVVAVTASVQPESGRIVYSGPDLAHPFELRFSKEGIDLIVQNRPGSNLDGLVRVWPNASSLEASWCAGIAGAWFLAVRNRPAVRLPLPDSVPFFHRRSG